MSARRSLLSRVVRGVLIAIALFAAWLLVRALVVLAAHYFLWVFGLILFGCFVAFGIQISDTMDAER